MGHDMGDDGVRHDHVLVLAAGLGRRMGGPKALMQVGGRPWWRVQAERLGAVGLPCTWVVNRQVEREFVGTAGEGGEGGEKGEPASIVLADGHRPMIDSILAGVRVLGDAAPAPRGVFVLPVDVPVPSRAVFDALARGGGGRGGAAPTVPAHGGARGHPVYLPWAWVERSLLAGPVAIGGLDWRLDAMIAPDARILAVDDPRVAMNINTPDDLERALRASV
jgi:nicotine blue oxidoreductase